MIGVDALIVSGFVFNIMKKSIPLKEIVGFLPYKMNCSLMSEYNEKENFLAEFSGLSIFKDGTERAEFIGFAYTIPFEDFKPIVRPLSDLTKQITHKGETFVPIHWLDENIKPTKNQSPSIVFTDGYIEMEFLKEIEKLYEWHFDIYDWIKDGLAIDLNTL